MDDNNLTLDGVDAMTIYNQEQRQYVRLAFRWDQFRSFRCSRKSGKIRNKPGAISIGEHQWIALHVEYSEFSGEDVFAVRRHHPGKGKHQLELGFEIRWVQLNQGTSQSGTLTYNSLHQFAKNQLNSATYVDELPLKRQRKVQYCGYVQDTYNTTRSLTLNLAFATTISTSFTR